MKTVSARELKEIDKRAIEEFGIAAVVLMENAGVFAARTALEMMGEGESGRVLVFCGTGNNGGDGMVIARHLINRGKEVGIFLLGERSGVKGPARVNLETILRMGTEIREIRNTEEAKKISGEIRDCALIVDAIFGIGLSGEVREPAKTVITAVNESGVPVMAVDIPSGLDADSGEVLGKAVRARVTVTFGMAKSGFFENNGPQYAGEIKVSDIGMPCQLLDQYGGRQG